MNAEARAASLWTAAALALGAAVSLGLARFAYALVLLFPAFALHRIVVFARDPGPDALMKAVVATMAALLSQASSRVTSSWK